MSHPESSILSWEGFGCQSQCASELKPFSSQVVKRDLFKGQISTDIITGVISINCHCLKVPYTDGQIILSFSEEKQERGGGIYAVDATLSQLTVHHLNQKLSIFLNTSCHKNIGVVCF